MKGKIHKVVIFGAALVSFQAAAFAEIVPNSDITSNIGTEVQDSRTRSLSLPGRLITNSLSMYDNPSRITDVSGVYMDGDAVAENTWGGVVIPLPFSIKAGIFMRRPLSESSPLRNCLVEPSTGKMEPFTTMVGSGTSVGVIDPTSQYFNSNTVFPSTTVSELATGNGRTRGFGNIDFFQGYQIQKLHIGLMESFSNSSQNLTGTLSDGSMRSLGYGASEERISAGLSTSPIGIIEADLSCTFAHHGLSFGYDASTSNSYPKVGFNNLSESVHCSTEDNSELGFFFRTIVTLNSVFKVYGTMCYSRYTIPVDVYGKTAASTSPATQEVRYSTSFEMTSYDVALHQTVSEGCTVIYSAGYSMVTQHYTKTTIVAPSSSDGSIWGMAAINDSRSTNGVLLPVGVSAEYKINERFVIRSGMRKYLWAPYHSSFAGMTGSSATSSSEQGTDATADQFFASAGLSVLLSPSLTMDADVVVANSRFSELSSDKSSVTGGISLRYTF
jgi:hypothetical protein